MSSDKEDIEKVTPEFKTIYGGDKDFNCDEYMSKRLKEIEEEIQLIRKQELQNLVAGALFDFAGYLTTRSQPVTFSASHDSLPAVALVSAFLRLRNFSPDCKPEIMVWQDKINT